MIVRVFALVALLVLIVGAALLERRRAARSWSFDAATEGWRVNFSVGMSGLRAALLEASSTAEQFGRLHERASAASREAADSIRYAMRSFGLRRVGFEFPVEPPALEPGDRVTIVKLDEVAEFIVEDVIPRAWPNGPTYKLKWRLSERDSAAGDDEGSA